MSHAVELSSTPDHKISTSRTRSQRISFQALKGLCIRFNGCLGANKPRNSLHRMLLHSMFVSSTSIISPNRATEDVDLICPLEDSNRNLPMHPNSDVGLHIIVHLDRLVPGPFPSEFLIAITFSSE